MRNHLKFQIQRGVTSDLGNASKETRQDRQSVSYTPESNQHDDYVTSDGEKVSRRSLLMQSPEFYKNIAIFEL